MPESHEIEQTDINNEAELAAEHLNELSKGLFALIRESDEKISMRLSTAAKNIGRLAKQADSAMQSEYGTD